MKTNKANQETGFSPVIKQNYILHGLPDVTLQSTRHEVISHGLREVTSDRTVISHDLSVT